jgi:hypothetical protein
LRGLAVDARPRDDMPMDPSARLKVINLFGPPGVGKSSVRSGLFWLMKSLHLSVEEVSEYAKYLVLTGRTWQLQDEQLYLLAKQHHKQLILRGHYEYAVTDSPLALCGFYAPPGYLASFQALVRDAHHSFENLNFYLTRDLDREPFEPAGRVHDLETSRRLDGEMREYLGRERIEYVEVPIDLLSPWRILEYLRPGLAPWPTFEAPTRRE